MKCSLLCTNESWVDYRSDVLVQNGRKIDHFSELLRKTPLRLALVRPSEGDGPLILCRGIDQRKDIAYSWPPLYWKEVHDKRELIIFIVYFFFSTLADP